MITEEAPNHLLTISANDDSQAGDFSCSTPHNEPEEQHHHQNTSLVEFENNEKLAQSLESLNISQSTVYQPCSSPINQMESLLKNLRSNYKYQPPSKLLLTRASTSTKWRPKFCPWQARYSPARTRTRPEGKKSQCYRCERHNLLFVGLSFPSSNFFV